MSYRFGDLRWSMSLFSLLSACQFDASRVPLTAKPRACAVEVDKTVVRTLLTGTKLAKLSAAVGYDQTIYVTHFDEEEARALKVVTNSREPCERVELVDAPSELHGCRTPHAERALSLLPDPDGMLVVVATAQPKIKSIYEEQTVIPIVFGDVSFPQAGHSDPSGTVRYALTTLSTPSVAIGTTSRRDLDLTVRQYTGAKSMRPRIVTTPGDRPWLFLGDTSAVFKGVQNNSWDLLCRLPLAAENAYASIDEDCTSLPFDFAAAATLGPDVHAAGTMLLEGDQQAVGYLRISQSTEDGAQGEDWLTQRLERVSPEPIEAREEPSPAIAIGPDGPVIVYAASNQLVVNYRKDESWHSYAVDTFNPGPLQVVHDLDGTLHVFFLADDNADRKSDALKHFSVPACTH